MHAIYVAVRGTSTQRTMKKANAPAQMNIEISGLVRYARPRNHPAKMMASTVAAAGGILRS